VSVTYCCIINNPQPVVEDHTHLPFTFLAMWAVLSRVVLLLVLPEICQASGVTQLLHWVWKVSDGLVHVWALG
jgi:hypothetical protein